MIGRCRVNSGVDAGVYIMRWAETSLAGFYFALGFGMPNCVPFVRVKLNEIHFFSTFIASVSFQRFFPVVARTNRSY